MLECRTPKVRFQRMPPPPHSPSRAAWVVIFTNATAPHFQARPAHGSRCACGGAADGGGMGGGGGGGGGRGGPDTPATALTGSFDATKFGIIAHECHACTINKHPKTSTDSKKYTVDHIIEPCSHHIIEPCMILMIYLYFPPLPAMQERPPPSAPLTRPTRPCLIQRAPRGLA